MDERKTLELSEPLADMYARVASQLIINVARHFKDGGGLSARSWQIKKLSELGALTEESAAIIAEGTGRKSEYIRDALAAALNLTASEVDAQMTAAARPPVGAVSASPSMAQVLEMFAAQAEDDTNLVNTVMLDSTRTRYLQAVERVYKSWEEGRIEELTRTDSFESLDRKLGEVQKIMNAGAGEAVLGAFSYTQAIRDTIGWLAEKGVTGFIDIGGHEGSPEAYVSMDIRTTIHNTAIKAQQTRAQEYGVYTFQISSKAVARALGAPYQGQICSWKRGDRGQVHDLNGKVHDYISIYDTSYGEPAGIFGINCGHFPETFIPGYSLARYDKPDKAELERNSAAYERMQEQREIERGIREAKTRVLAYDAAGSKEGFEKWALKLNERRMRYREYCINHGVSERTNRIQVYGFDRRLSQKAARVERRQTNDKQG